MTNMRDKIVLAMNSHNTDVRVGAAMDDFEEVGGHTNHLHALHADVILAALPYMIAPLVWEKHSSNSTAQQKHFYSGRYTLILMHDGYLVEFSDLSLGHGYSLGVAKSLADSHHRASIMAAFTGATSK